MRYYDETRMASMHRAMDAATGKWPAIARTMMFGCPCYKAGGRLFAFPVTDGLVLTRLSPDDRLSVAQRFKAEPFSTGTRRMGGWPQLPLKNALRLKTYLPLIRRSYRSALAASRLPQSGASRKQKR